MDVELIQKINNLAQDLMKQGLADNRDDAINQAEKVLKGNGEGDYSDLRETINQVEAAKKVENNSEQTKENLPETQVRNILEQNTKFMVKTIKDFQEKIYSLEKEMAELKNKVTYSKLPTVNDIVTSKKIISKSSNVEGNETQIEDAQEVPPIETSAENTQENSENHPRVGRFEENDVSIEKFFYYGR